MISLPSLQSRVPHFIQHSGIHFLVSNGSQVTTIAPKTVLAPCKLDSFMIMRNLLFIRSSSGALNTSRRLNENYQYSYQKYSQKLPRNRMKNVLWSIMALATSFVATNEIYSYCKSHYLKDSLENIYNKRQQGTLRFMLHEWTLSTAFCDDHSHPHPMANTSPGTHNNSNNNKNNNSIPFDSHLPKDTNNTGSTSGPDYPITRYTIANAIQLVSPAVVNIAVQIYSPYSFFTPWDSHSSSPLMSMAGSGFIFDESGLILTNAHVVAPAARHSGAQTTPYTSNDDLQHDSQYADDGFWGLRDLFNLPRANDKKHEPVLVVTLQDGRTFQGTVQKIDKLADVAIVKINAETPLPVASLGTSANLRQGEWVIALGSPLTLKNTVTVGIISAVQRDAYELGFYSAVPGYIQTDAPINVGNSGGPLVNLDGQVVGINTMKALSSDGISFALPIDYAKDVVHVMQSSDSQAHDMVNHASVKRPHMGVKVLTFTPQLAQEILSSTTAKRAQNQDSPGWKQLIEDAKLNPGQGLGILVHQVLPGAPAHQGGLQAGDVIIQMSGIRVRSTKDFIKILNQNVDKDVSFVVLRGHEMRKVELVVHPTFAKPGE